MVAIVERLCLEGQLDVVFAGAPLEGLDYKLIRATQVFFAFVYFEWAIVTQ